MSLRFMVDICRYNELVTSLWGETKPTYMVFGCAFQLVSG